MRTNADIDLYVSHQSAADHSGCERGGHLGQVAHAQHRDRRGVGHLQQRGPGPGLLHRGEVRGPGGRNTPSWALASQLPFDEARPQRQPLINISSIRPASPPRSAGSPALPGHATIIGFSILLPDLIQDVAVTTGITHPNFGDLIGTLTHGPERRAQQPPRLRQRRPERVLHL